MDMNNIGPLFAWTNKRTIGFVAKKLDRFLVNSSWLQYFPDLAAQFTAPSFLDHCAGRLILCNRTMKSPPPSPSNYSIFWQIKEIVWRLCNIIGVKFNHMVPICIFIARSWRLWKVPWSLWIEPLIVIYTKKVTNTQEELLHVQMQLLSHPFDILAQSKKFLSSSLAELTHWDCFSSTKIKNKVA